MRKKTQLTVFVSILILLCIASYLTFMGCAGSQPKELTPEQKQALEDSLYRVHKGIIALKWSLGYEPYKQGDYAKAKKYFGQVARMDTTGVYGKILYQLLGDCYVRLNEPDSAEWAYQTGVARLPDNPYFYKALSYIYRVGGRTDEAIQMYVTLTTLEPDSASHYAALGELYVNVDDVDAAIENLNTAVQLNPNDIKSQEILSNLLSSVGDIDQMIATQEGLVDNEPSNMKYRLDLAQSYHKAGYFEKAIEQLTVVVQNEPGNVLALEFLGDSYQQVEQYSDGVSVYQKILEMNPEDKKNICNLALCYTNLGRYTTAMTQIRNALRIDSSYGLAYLTRGIIYETAAERCIDNKTDGRIDFEDKLVYKLAFNQFQRAKDDLQWKSDAERRASYVQPYLPTRSDYFMNDERKTPRGSCYEWIN